MLEGLPKYQANVAAVPPLVFRRETMRPVISLLVVLGLALLPRAVAGQDSARETLEMGAEAFRQERWGDAEALFGTAFELSTGKERSTAAFARAMAAFRQGEDVARSNTAGDPDLATQAEEHFARVMTLLEHTSNPQAPAVSRAAAQHIRQQRVIRDQR